MSMGKPKFKWNNASFEALRRSPEAVNLLEGLVEGAADAAGPGYVGSVVQGVGRGSLGRAIGTVYTDDFKAIKDNAKNQTLMRVFDRLGDV
jgi:hypothetical protein